MSSNWIKTIIGAIISIRLIYLAETERLTLYVHPRYVLFTCIMAIIGLVVYIFQLRNKTILEKPSRLDLAVLALVLLIISLPAKPLSSRVAQARQLDQATLQQSAQSSFDLFTRDYTHFDLQDWVAFLATQPSEEIVSGKEARVSGFIYENQPGQNSIARFRLSCCAVDATPLSIPLMNNEAVSSLSKDAWYELQGTILYDEVKQQYALNVSESKQIDIPKEQYVY